MRGNGFSSASVCSVREYIPHAVIVDDDDALRAMLAKAFEASGFEVTTFGNAVEFFAALDERHLPDDTCLILDVRMPLISGLDVQQQLIQRGVEAPVIFYTGAADVGVAVRAMAAGAYSLFEKPMSNQVLIDKALEAIANNRLVQDHRKRIRKASQSLMQLSVRERQIVDLLAQGLSAKEIGSTLHISARTVETHRNHIVEKLGVKSVAGLAQLVILAEMARMSA